MNLPVSPAFMMQNTRPESDSETLIPLEDIVRNAYSASAVKNERDRMSIDAIMNDPAGLSNPAVLADLQNRLGDYTIYVSLVSTIARKATTTVETLIKAQ